MRSPAAARRARGLPPSPVVRSEGRRSEAGVAAEARVEEVADVALRGIEAQRGLQRRNRLALAPELEQSPPDVRVRPRIVGIEGEGALVDRERFVAAAQLVQRP